MNARDDGPAGQDLSSLMVLDISSSPGPSFAGSLLADFGAFVVVVEPPGGSYLRKFGPPAVQDVWWPIAARNKFSLALDATRPEASFVVARLLEAADVILRDNAAPVWTQAAQGGTDAPVDVYIHAPGVDRPDLWSGSTDPRFATAATGAMALTGDKDAAPFQAEFPLTDYCAGMLAAASALVELRACKLEGRSSRPISIGLHEAMLRMNEWQLVFASARGYPELRNGNRFPLNVNIGNIFRTQDNRLITLSAATGPVASRLLALIGGESLRDDPRFATVGARRENMDELELIIGKWIAHHSAADILRMGREADVVIGPIMDADDIATHPQVAALGNIIHMPAEDGRPIAMPDVFPRIAGVKAEITHVGGAAGAHSDRVLARLGLTAKEIGALRQSGAIWA